MIFLSMDMQLFHDQSFQDERKIFWAGAGELPGVDSAYCLMLSEYLRSKGESIKFDEYLFYLNDYSLKNLFNGFIIPYFDNSIIVFDRYRHLSIISHWMHTKNIPHQFFNDHLWKKDNPFNLLKETKKEDVPPLPIKKEPEKIVVKKKVIENTEQLSLF